MSSEKKINLENIVYENNHNHKEILKNGMEILSTKDIAESRINPYLPKNNSLNADIYTSDVVLYHPNGNIKFANLNDISEHLTKTKDGLQLTSQFSTGKNIYDIIPKTYEFKGKELEKLNDDPVSGGMVKHAIFKTLLNEVKYSNNDDNLCDKYFMSITKLDLNINGSFNENQIMAKYIVANSKDRSITVSTSDDYQFVGAKEMGESTSYRS